MRGRAAIGFYSPFLTASQKGALKLLEGGLAEDAEEMVCEGMRCFLTASFELTRDAVIEQWSSLDRGALEAIRDDDSEEFGMADMLRPVLWNGDQLSPFGDRLLRWHQGELPEGEMALPVEELNNYLVASVDFYEGLRPTCTSSGELEVPLLNLLEPAPAASLELPEVVEELLAGEPQPVPELTMLELVWERPDPGMVGSGAGLAGSEPSPPPELQLVWEGPSTEEEVGSPLGPELEPFLSPEVDPEPGTVLEMHPPAFGLRVGSESGAGEGSQALLEEGPELAFEGADQAYVEEPEFGFGEADEAYVEEPELGFEDAGQAYVEEPELGFDEPEQAYVEGPELGFDDASQPYVEEAEFGFDEPEQAYVEEPELGFDEPGLEPEEVASEGEVASEEEADGASSPLSPSPLMEDEPLPPRAGKVAPAVDDDGSEILEISAVPLSPLEQSNQLIVKKKYLGYGKNSDGVMGYCGQLTLSRFDDQNLTGRLESSNPLLFLTPTILSGKSPVVMYWMPPAAFPQPGGHLTISTAEQSKVLSVGSLFPKSRTDFLNGRQVLELLMAPSFIGLFYFMFVYLLEAGSVVDQVKSLFPDAYAAAVAGSTLVDFRTEGVGLYQLEVVPASESLQLIWAALIFLCPLIATKFYRHLSRSRQRSFGAALAGALLLPSVGLFAFWNAQKALYPLFSHASFAPLDLRNFLPWSVPLNVLVAIYLFLSVHGVWDRRIVSRELRFILPAILTGVYFVACFLLIFGRSWTSG